MASTTNIHVTALDGVMNMNSLFTFAIFVGLSSATPGAQSSLEGPQCDAGPAFAKRLVVFKVLSFSCFLTSSLVALGLKLALVILNSKELHDAVQAPIKVRILGLGMFISGAGSLLGCLFLVLSMVDFIQIRLGTLSCGTAAIKISFWFLVLPVGMGVVMYAYTTSHAYWQKAKLGQHTRANQEQREESPNI